MFTLCIWGSGAYVKKKSWLDLFFRCFASCDVLMIHSILYVHKNFESKTNNEFWETTELWSINVEGDPESKKIIAALDWFEKLLKWMGS